MRRIKTLAVLVLASLAMQPGARGADDHNVIRADRATLTLSWRGSDADLGRPGLHDWIERSAQIVSSYYGEFPLDKVAIQISIGEGDRVMGGRTFGAPDAVIELRVGRHVSAQALHDDWVLVHEMIHLALPGSIRPRKPWGRRSRRKNGTPWKRRNAVASSCVRA